MTIIKHRANFAELIAQAAKQKKANATKEDDVYRKVKLLHDKAAAEDEYSSSRDSSERSMQVPSDKSSILKSGISTIMNPTHKTKAKNFQMSYYAYKLVESVPFRVTRLVIIALAFFLLGCDTDRTLREKPVKVALDSVVDVFFIVIGVMKFFSLNFRNSLIEHVNEKMSFMGMLRNSGILNISISICSLIFVSYPTIGGWFRLLRVCVLTAVELNQIPQIDVLMSGMILGARSLASTWMLLSLVFLIYSTTCVTLFRESDPFHFGSIPMAMWTFFELSTLDNWSIVLYINMYGCDSYPSYYYNDFSQYKDNSTFIYRHGDMFLPVCTHPQESSVRAPILFTSFILICGFILISLTVAAVTGGINDRLKCIEQEGLTRALQETAAQYSTKNTIVHDEDMLFAMLKKVWVNQESFQKESSQHGFEKSLSMIGAGLKSMVSFRKPTNSGKNFTPKVKENFVTSNLKVIQAVQKQNSNRAKSFFRKLSGQASSTTNLNIGHHHNSSPKKLSTPLEYCEDLGSNVYDEEIGEDGAECSCFDCFDKRFLGLYMRDLTHGPFYNGMLLWLVCVAAFFEIWAVQTAADVTAIDVLQIVLQILFTIDIICRILSHYPGYISYLHFNWNVFDCTLVLLTWVPIFTSGKVLGLLRVLRILRVLRLLNDIADLNIILQAIGSSASALFYVTGLMLLFFYLFAVAGVFMFAENDHFHFGSLSRAFICLYQISTLDDWGDVARTNMYGCDYYGYDSGNAEYDAQCENPKGLGYIAAMYFGVFIVFGVYVLISLFVGIIITSMELLRDSIKEEDEVWEKVRENQMEYNWKDSMVENLLEIFNSMDIEQNGKLTLNELKPILKIVHVTETDQFSLFMKVDKDSSGQIDFAEFLELVHLIGIAYQDIIKNKKAVVPNMSALKQSYSVRAMSMFGKPSEHTPTKYGGLNKDMAIHPEPNAGSASPGKSIASRSGPELLEEDEEDEGEGNGNGGAKIFQGDSDASMFTTGELEVIASGPNKESEEEKL
mmetsp:Transcript_8029/g.13615  ORF Transcript_8029/g.13615 Transcript_8029/m.13615 type:complete len:1010 (-) Transcript_8029:710-3739(-)